MRVLGVPYLLLGDLANGAGDSAQARENYEALAVYKSCRAARTLFKR